MNKFFKIFKQFPITFIITSVMVLGIILSMFPYPMQSIGIYVILTDIAAFAIFLVITGVLKFIKFFKRK